MGNENQPQVIGALRRLTFAERHGKHVGQEGVEGQAGGSAPGFTHAEGSVDSAGDWAVSNVEFVFNECENGEGERCLELKTIQEAMVLFEEVLGIKIEDLVVTDNFEAIASLIYPELVEKHGFARVAAAIKRKTRGAMMGFVKSKIGNNVAVFINYEALDKARDKRNLAPGEYNFDYVVLHELGHYLQFKTGQEKFAKLDDRILLLQTPIFDIYNSYGYPSQEMDDEFRSDFLAAYILAGKDSTKMKLGPRFKDYEPSEWVIGKFESELKEMQDKAKEAGLALRATKDEYVHVAFELFGGVMEIIPIKKSTVPEGVESIEDALAKLTTKSVERAIMPDHEIDIDEISYDWVSGLKDAGIHTVPIEPKDGIIAMPRARVEPKEEDVEKKSLLQDVRRSLGGLIEAIGEQYSGVAQQADVARYGKHIDQEGDEAELREEENDNKDQSE